MPLFSISEFESTLAAWTVEQLGEDSLESRDLVFLCEGGEVLASQARVATLSPLLKTLLQNQACCGCGGKTCTKREAVTIQVEIHREVMSRLLWLIHTGSVQCKDKAQADSITQGLQQLGIVLSLECDQTTADSGNIRGMERAFPARKRMNGDKVGEDNGRRKRPRLGGGDEDPVKLQVEMAKDLTTTSKDCNMPGCEDKVSLLTMTEHYTEHVVQHQAKGGDVKPIQQDIVMFKCSICAKSFKLRKARDHHEKNHQKSNAGTPEPVKKTNSTDKMPEGIQSEQKIFVKTEPGIIVQNTNNCYTQPFVADDIYSFTSENVSESNGATNHYEYKEFKGNKSMKMPKEAGDREYKECPGCRKVYTMFGRGAYYYRQHMETCSKMDASKSALSELTRSPTPGRSQISDHMDISSPDKDGPQTPEKLNLKKAVNALVEKVISTQCQICQMNFTLYSDMRSHYVNDHYWTRLENHFGVWKLQCYFCLVSFSSKENLLKHVGNFHCARSLDIYLQEDGYKGTTREWTVKLLSTNCRLCGKDLNTSAALKSHLSVAHFARQLNMEFLSPQKSKEKCPKCLKCFGNSSMKASHIGSFHDEVLKYARDLISVNKSEEVIIPVHGLNEEGVKFKMDSTEQSLKIKLIERSGPNATPATIEYFGENRFQCRKCRDWFDSRDVLKRHIAMNHYKEKLSKVYPGTACQICSYVSENNDALIEHISDNHEKVLVFLLKKEGLLLPPNQAKKDKTPPVEVKNETSIDANATANYPIAATDDTTATTFDIIATTMEINESPILESVDSGDLCVSVDTENEKPVSENVLNGIRCYLCDEDLSNTSQDEIRQHLCNHHQPELDSKFLSDTSDVIVDGKYVCPKCGKIEGDKFDFLDHMGILHKAVDEFIPQHFRDLIIGKKQISLQAGSSMTRKCAIQGCMRTLQTKELYLMHLIYSHFRERLDAEFGKDFTEENTVCPICKASLAVNKSGFMKHLGVVHEMGLKYIEQNTDNLGEIFDVEEEEIAAVCPNNS